MMKFIIILLVIFLLYPCDKRDGKINSNEILKAEYKVVSENGVDTLINNTFEVFKSMRFLLFLDEEQGVISSKFIETVISDSKPYYDIQHYSAKLDSLYQKYKRTLNIFSISDSIRPLKENLYLFTLQGFGYEASPTAFMIFSKRNNQFKFESIVDKYFMNFYGGVEVLEVTKNSFGDIILICSEKGGDGADYYGKIWIGSLNNEYQLKIHHTKEFEVRNSQDEKTLSYDINFTDNEVYLKLHEENYQIDGSIISKTSIDTVNYKYLF